MTEADVARARMSVEMTEGLLDEKMGKIAQLEQRIHEKSQQNTSFMTRIVTSVRGSSEHQGPSLQDDI